MQINLENPQEMLDSVEKWLGCRVAAANVSQGCCSGAGFKRVHVTCCRHRQTWDLYRAGQV